MVSDDFAMDETPENERRPEQLVLDLDGFEGPLDVLLSLARDQKVDITRLSILQLADQYLSFITHAQNLRLEIAADYLVMAAWLAYLKSRLLLPKQEDDEEPSGPEMAAALTFQLQRLEAIRDVGARLMARPQLGKDFFKRGESEPFPVISNVVYEVTLFDLLKAYANQQTKAEHSVLTIREPEELYSIEDARMRLISLVGKIPDWSLLVHFLPSNLKEGLGLRSAIASTFAASLELANSGEVNIRQDQAFGPILLKSGRKAAPAPTLKAVTNPE